MHPDLQGVVSLRSGALCGHAGVRVRMPGTQCAKKKAAILRSRRRGLPGRF